MTTEEAVEELHRAAKEFWKVLVEELRLEEIVLFLTGLLGRLYHDN